MGFLNTWKVSGITDKASKESGTLELYHVGQCIQQGNEEDLDDVFPMSYDDSKLFANHSLNLINTYISGDTSVHDNAVIALVGLSALLFGYDNKEFDRKEIRNFSQGLYGSMTETPDIFQSQNVPIFERILR
jgi:hypothetical protein